METKRVESIRTEDDRSIDSSFTLVLTSSSTFQKNQKRKGNKIRSDRREGHENIEEMIKKWF